MTDARDLIQRLADDLARHGVDDEFSMAIVAEARAYLGTTEPAAAEPKPGSVVEAVANAIAAADDEGLTNMTWNHHARASVKAVADWLEQKDIDDNNDTDSIGDPLTMDDAVQMLRTEADRITPP